MNRFTVAALLALLALPVVAAAQGSARLVEGKVLRPADGSTPRPVGGQWVVLHRVGTDAAGAIDSVRSAANGDFRFRYEASGSPDALYFVSAMYGGIAYFSPPLRSAAVRGGDADITVYDTTRDTSSLRVQGRHIVVSLARGARREIAEVFEIENTSARTVVASDSAPVWATAIPDDADSASIAPGDVSASAVRFTKGRAEIFAPLSPGVRQFVITYLLPNDAFPVSFPVQRPTPLLEVLLEDPRGTAGGVLLREVDPATIEGRSFRRLLGQEVGANAVVRIDVPPAPRDSRLMVVVIVAVAAVLLLALAVWMARRKSPRPQGARSASADGESRVEGLVARLASLDASHERAPRDAVSEGEYQRRRAALKAELQRALAEQERPS